MIRIKNPKQIELIRKSCRLAALSLRHVEQYVLPGVSTEEINNKAEQFIRDHGGIPASLNYRDFPKAVCTSLNEVICHGVPSGDVILKEGDILNVDIATILDGYFGDNCKMYTVGEVSENAKRLIRVTKECLEVGIRQVRPDNYFGNIGYEINKYATAHGYSVVWQFCGHGVGVHYHEEPNVSHIANENSGPKMKPGMIFTIEPMINEGVADSLVDEADGWTARTADGKLSAQFEHTVLVTKDGVEVLTAL